MILDTTNTRDPTTQVITLNRPGLYDIKASIGKIGDGTQVTALKLMVIDQLLRGPMISMPL